MLVEDDDPKTKKAKSTHQCQYLTDHDIYTFSAIHCSNNWERLLNEWTVERTRATECLLVWCLATSSVKIINDIGREDRVCTIVESYFNIMMQIWRAIGEGEDTIRFIVNFFHRQSTLSQKDKLGIVIKLIISQTKEKASKSLTINFHMYELLVVIFYLTWFSSRVLLILY